MQIEYTLDQEDYIAFNAFTARTHTGLTAQTARMRTAVTAAVAVAILLVIAGLQHDAVGGAVTAAITAAVVWFVFPPLHRWNVDRTLRRLAARGGLGSLGTVSLTLDEAGLHEELVGVTSSATWARVERVDETDDHAFVFVGPVAAVIIPKRHPQAADVIVEIRRYVGARA